MNSRHSEVTDWGLAHASIGERDIILDVGCGGGRTMSKLARIATFAEHLGEEALSQREVEVLQQLAEGKRNRDIAAGLFIAEETRLGKIRGPHARNRLRLGAQ